jgi:HEPN domain-containing protein
LSVDEEYKLFIEKSRRYFEDALDNYKKEYYDLSMFSLHQCLELFLKALLIKRAGDFPHAHNIRNLLEILLEIENDGCKVIIKNYINKYGLELSILTDGYITSRYFESSYNGNNIEKLINVVKDIKEGMEDVC